MGRPARIDRAGVLACGLAVADVHGVEALTMGAVAEHLGVTPMALYRHVANKADLLDGIVELLLTDFPPLTIDADWTERLSELAHAIRLSAHRHPNVFPLLLQRPAATPGALQTRDGIHAALRAAGVRPRDVAQVERLISTAILGFAASESAGRFHSHTRQQLDADFELLLAMLRQFIDTQRAR